MARIAGDTDRPRQVPSDRRQHLQVLRLIPQAPCREDERLLARLPGARSTPVMDDLRRRQRSVLAHERIAHRVRGRDDVVGRMQGRHDVLPVAVPRCGRSFAVHRAPPRAHARMRRHHDRAVPSHIAVRQIVQMHDVGSELARQRPEP
jgi:hypothetical protein